MTPYEELLDDLAAEHRALDTVLARVTPAQWALPTHAPGWLVRDQVAHLAHFDAVARLAIVDADRFAEDVAASRGDRAAGYEPRYLARGRVMTPPELLGWWRGASVALVAAARTADPKARLPWYGPDMSAVSFVTARLMETWSHGLDVVDVVGIERPDTDRLRHVVFLGVRTRQYSYTNRGLAPDTTPVYVELRAPSGATWAHGETGAENRIAGTAVDFCRVVTRRRHAADTDLEVVGASAQEWMHLAQAFAGPPGEGRRPGQFPKDQGGIAMSDEVKNVELLRQAYERWHSSKGQTADHWMGLLADNVEFKSLAEGAHGVEFTAMRRSRREVGAYFEGLAKDWEMHYYRIDEYVAQGNCVVAIGECSFKHRRNGKDLITPKVDIWHFENGKVVKFFELYDTANVLAAARG